MENDENLKELKRAILNKEVILFVGSGVSRILGLPSWSDLMRDFASELEFDEEIFMRQGSFLELAEYYKIQKKSLSSLCKKLDNSWHEDEAKSDNSEVHRLIVKIGFPIIYTTNYDRWIEIAHQRLGQKISVVKGLLDLQKRPSSEATQIIKYHGDLEKPDDIVLTETSYFERFNFENPLDIRFRSDSLTYKILFIGYSLSDINVRYLLFKLNKLQSDNDINSKNQSYIFLNSPNPIQETLLRERHIIPIIGESPDPEQSLTDFLKAVSGES
ncbi:MAG: hypothetical protein ACJAT2_002863 [Bacteriovoracaceae bacterium]|jgi:hypothetical protein